MTTLPPTIVDTSMTLVLAVSNSRKIAVGTDSHRQKEHEDGSNETLYDAKKLWDITKDCVVMLAGRKFSFEKIDQFIFDFTETIRELKLISVDEIAKKFEEKIQRVPDSTHTDLEFVIAGYNDETPKLYYMDNKHGFQLTQCLDGYAVAGKQSEARKALSSLRNLEDMTLVELEKTAQKVLSKVHFQFPSEVGGNLSVKVL